MTALELDRAPSFNDTPPPLIHFEHPEHPGQAWCGAPVIGVPAGEDAECVVCIDLYDTRWPNG